MARPPRVQTPPPSGSTYYAVGAWMPGKPGKPGGTPPANPTVNQTYKGPQGVNWYWDGKKWRKGSPEPTQLVTPAGRGAAAAANGETVQTPVVGRAAASAPAWKPDANWWRSQFTAGSANDLSRIAGRQNETAQTVGYRLRYAPSGQLLFRAAGGAEGSGTYVQDFDDNGKVIYRDVNDPSKLADPATLEADMIALNKGEVGYGNSQRGAAVMGADAENYKIGDAAAQSGAGRSGMRAFAASQNYDRLNSALYNLARTGMRDVNAAEDDKRRLFLDKYPGLAEIAAGLMDASQTPPPAPEAPAAPEAPVAPPTSTPVPGGGSANAAGQYTPPAAGTTLTDAAFSSTLNEILGPPSQRGPQPLSKGDRIRMLRNVYDSYPLTPAQRERVKKELKALGFVIK